GLHIATPRRGVLRGECAADGGVSCRAAAPAPPAGARRRRPVGDAAAEPPRAEQEPGMKFVPLLAAGVGVALVGGLIVYFGAGAVLRSLVAVGFVGFAAVCLIHLVLIGVMGVAWRALLPDG